MATTAHTENKELVREYHEAEETQQVDQLADFFADEFTVEIITGTESEETGVDEVMAQYEEVFAAFSTRSIEEMEMAAEGDWVICRVEVTATHDGEYHGIEPTGNEVWIQAHESFRIKDGKFVEHHRTASTAHLLAQLGVDLPGAD